nr:Phenylacetic acid catabolic protein [Marinicella sp. W31]MDC2878552.1 phenylacetate-CoA oxygenase subunit PaaI [Marinicella sp. W31]
MRLSVFHYPFENWTDAVVMNVLMGLATVIQLEEMTHVSYTPFAEVLRAVAPREKRHTELGLEGLRKLAESGEGGKAAQMAVAYWHPRVAATFGPAVSERFARLSRFGLRHTENDALRTRWQNEAQSVLEECGLKTPVAA